MIVRTFMPRMAPLVESGQKHQTVRKRPKIEQLIAAGYMRLSHYINQDKDGIYTVTPDGQAAWQQALADRNQGKKRLTRSQQRYRAWLRTDCGESFGTWLKRQKHRNAA